MGFETLPSGKTQEKVYGELDAEKATAQLKGGTDKTVPNNAGTVRSAVRNLITGNR